MSFLPHLKALLDRKVAVLAGAAVLLGSGAAIAGPATPETAPVAEIVSVSDGDEAIDGTGDGERSEVAGAVHEALTGGLSPGDDGFGQAVAENARGGGNGAAASSAARTANGSTRRGHRNEGPEIDGASDDTAGRGAAQGRGPGGAGPPGHAKGR